MDEPLIKPTDAGLIETKRNFLYSAGCAFELTKWIIVLVIALSLVHFFFATIFIVDGVSMQPNFESGEFIIVNRWQYLFGEPKRGDVLVLKFPGDEEHKKYIKRLIGLPGEKVEITSGQVFINGQLLNEPYIPFETLPSMSRVLKNDEYFLMGDNRPNSSDSRIWGVANKRFLIGSAWFQIYPKIKVIDSVDY